MKNSFILLIFSLSFLMFACANSELYEKTDYFVDQLSTTYESYGLFGITTNETVTSDGYYKIAPIGRLINVRIEDVNATSEDYDKLRNRLEKHYKGDHRVKDVYICGGGTIMIDCRN